MPIVVAVVVGGCTTESPGGGGGAGGGAATGGAAGTGGGGLLACDPALSLSPAAVSLARGAPLAFTAAGGTGAYRFRVVEGYAGGSVDAADGTYVAGDLPGFTDRVVVTDAGCTGDASAVVTILPPLAIEPAAVEVAPRQVLEISVSGGSGSYACVLESAATGASLTGCVYTAGPAEAQDVVRVTDAETGEVLDAVITVSNLGLFRVLGTGNVFVPVGEPYRPQTIGSARSLDIEVLEGAMSVDGESVTGTALGNGRIRVTDPLAGASAEVRITFVDSYTAEAEPDGEATDTGVVVDAGDLDGDGHPDGVLGFIELSLSGHMSGAVLVFEGDSGGLRATPVQVIGGSSRMDFFARGLDVADLDGDGQSDLIVGIDGLDLEAPNSGGVAVYPGVAGAFFAEEAAHIYTGNPGSGHFGFSVAACDFDADGWIDLAVGAPFDEHPDGALGAAGQGAVHVFRGEGGGLSDVPHRIFYGELPDGGGALVPAADMGFGEVVRAGDVDGDGACDLIVGAPSSDIDGNDEDGTVQVFHGVDVAAGGELLSATPTLLFAADGDGRFGNDAEVADLNGDGIGDLILAHYRADLSASRGGAVYVFLGPLGPGDPTLPILPGAADWLTSGTGTFDYVGSDVASADTDGDGHAELIVGASRAEETAPNTGQLFVYAGATITADVAADPGHDATGDTPWGNIIGSGREGRLGQAVGLVGTRGLLSLAGYDSTYGVEAGAPYYVSFSNLTPRLLGTAGVAAGHELGQSAALFDVDGDGDRDLLAGAPGAADADNGANSGLLFTYAANDSPNGTVISRAPSRFTTNYRYLETTDRFGFIVQSAGDFDGDGFEDLAVVARGNSKPSSFAGTYANPNECPGSVSRAGSVLLFPGSAAGLSPTPSFVAYGYDSQGFLRALAGQLDVNDDGYDDLVIGSATWTSNDRGGIGIVYGRARAPGGTTVVCDVEVFLGEESFGHLGSALASLGDLDGDGCDDVAIGASGENQDTTDQGVVRVLWGWGGAGCSAGPRLSTAALGIRYARAGTSLDAGRDIDGDGIGDLAVGGPGYRVNEDEVGSAWLVPGAHLLTLSRVGITPGTLPASPLVEPLLPDPEPDGSLRFAVLGDVANGALGEAVALVPDPVVAGRWALAAGAPGAGHGGVEGAGGAAIHRFLAAGVTGAPGLDRVPYILLSGETLHPGGEVGATLRYGDLDGVPVLLVGAPRSSRAGLETGGVYVLTLAAAAE